MTTEETPLLAEERIHLGHSYIYDRFGPWQKRGIVALVSCSGLLPLFASGTFIPAIPQIAHDLATSPEIVTLTISMSIFGTALGSMAMATYSGFYGRRPVYLAGLPVFCLGSYQIAISQNIYYLIAWRFIQNVGISGGISLGAGVIGDIYKLEERGFAMGVFFGGVLLGPAIAPVTGGIATHYASWRMLQWGFLICGLALLISMALWLPETSHPGTLGVEKAEDQQPHGGTRRQKWRWVWLNPLSCLGLLRNPNLMLVMLAGTAVLVTEFVLLVPLAYTIGAKYGITNEALIGAVFIPCGVGNMVGAPLAGYISDQIIVAYRAKRGGDWYPEDRLRGTLLGAAFCVPLSVLFTGLTIVYVPGRMGLFLCLVWLFMNGIGVDLVLSPSSAYNVDVVHTRSAEVMAANSGCRALLLSFVVPVILPSINSFGVVATNTVAALLAWVGMGLLIVTIRYGKQLRSWMDVEFSTRCCDTVEPNVHARDVIELLSARGACRSVFTCRVIEANNNCSSCWVRRCELFLNCPQSRARVPSHRNDIEPSDHLLSPTRQLVDLQAER
ncbi:MFS transporter superfamily protein [Pleurotus pulmonarius]